MPQLLMVSDFRRIHVCHRTTGKGKRFLTKDLKDNIRQFAAIAGYEAARDYDPLAMPADLLKAHQALDRAVMRLYGFAPGKTSEAECVASLMRLYQALAATP